MTPSSSLLSGYTPSDLGLPAKFQSFRPIQIDGMEYALYGANQAIGPRAWTLMGLPAGSGKSLTAQTIGKMSGVKFVVLTATRSLEDQAARDFGECGLVNVRGRANYECVEPAVETDADGKVVKVETQTCEEGGESGCKYAGTPRCTYGNRVALAKASDAILTNDQYWYNVRSHNRMALETDGRPIELLIIDEFHLMASSLARFLGFWIGDLDLRRFADAEIRACVKAGAGAEWGRVTQAWVDALDTAWIKAESRREDLEAQFGGQAAAMRKSKEYRRLGKLATGLQRIVELGGDNNWIWRQTRQGISFDCIWPGRYAPRYAWSGIPRVIGMSATLRPKHAQLMGLATTQYSFKEWPRQFPAALNPVWWVPTGKLGIKEDYETKMLAVKRHDEIIEAGWGQYKGLVHTGSYARAEWLQRESRYGRRMILPSQGQGGMSATEALERHLKDPNPTTLVGPVYTTGWDLLDDACRWIHWLKLPYPDRSDPIVQARAESDPEWYDCETMQAFVQGCHRGNRHEKDWCTVMVTDDSIDRFRKYAGKYAPGYFRVMDAPGGKIPRPPTRSYRCQII